MRIDKTEMIAGQPILRVRDFLRSIGDNGFTDLEIAHRFKVSQGGAAEILRELRARSWVEPREEHEPGWYEVSMRGRALAAARAVPPISRMAAELLMKRFLERVSDVNGRDELTHRVTEVRVFGSYLTSSEDLGDIDLAVELRFRNIPGRDPIKYNEERADQSGKRFRSWFEMAAYGESEVRRLLKQRSPYISLHPLSDIAATGSESKVLFVAEPEKGCRLRQQSTLAATAGLPAPSRGRRGSFHIEVALVEPEHFTQSSTTQTGRSDRLQHRAPQGADRARDTPDH